MAYWRNKKIPNACRWKLVRVALVLSAALIWVGIGPSLPARAQSPVLIETVVQSGLTYPWDLAFAPDGRLFVTERGGTLRSYASGDSFAPLLNTATITVHADGEAGLMGLALDPDFDANGYLYVCASREDEGQWRNQVLRYTVSGDAIDSETYVIRSGMRANRHHDGCRIRFAPDGTLWVTMGDAEDAGISQNPNVLNGKVLRINSDGTLPDDNTILPGASGRGAAYTMGHRNPQGITFQPGTGLPFVSEHTHHRGTSERSEHDAIYVLQPGVNFGWPELAGPDTDYAQPAWTSGNETMAASGSTFLAGTTWGAWDGSLVVATLKGQRLLRFDVRGTALALADELLSSRYGRLRAPVLGPDGDVYVTTSNGESDSIIRVSPTF